MHGTTQAFDDKYVNRYGGKKFGLKELQKKEHSTHFYRTKCILTRRHDGQINQDHRRDYSECDIIVAAGKSETLVRN